MPETLVLRMPQSATAQATWMVVDVAGTRIGEVSSGSLSEAHQAAQQRKLTVLLPANDCLVSHSDMPLKNTQKLLQALPFSFEDQLITNTDDMQFAAGQRDSEGKFVVAAVQRDTLDDVISTLAEHHLVANQIIPSDAALPITPGGCSILIEAEEALLRTTDGDTVSMMPDSLVAALQLIELRRGEESPLPVSVYIDDTSGEQGEATIALIHEAFAHAEFRRLTHGALSKLAVESLNPEQPNLLQGDYAPSTSYDKMLTPWKPAAIAAGVFMALLVGYKAVELSTMKSRLTELNNTMQALAKETYPDRQRFPDPPGLFRAEMRDAGGSNQVGGSEFLEYIDTVAAATKDASGLGVRRMSFRPGNLDLEVEAPSLQLLDGFATQISASASIDANLNSTKTSGDTVQGRVQLKRGQP